LLLLLLLLLLLPTGTDAGLDKGTAADGLVVVVV
jgi:hypothetical protein